MRNRSIILLLMCGLVGGCISAHTDRYADFTAPQTVFDAKDMLIGARLVGAVPSGVKGAPSRLTRQKAPYALMIYVISETGFYRSARIADIQLFGPGKRYIPLSDAVRSPTAPFREHLGRYVAEMAVGDLTLSYKPHLLTGTVEITTQANSTFERKIQFVFEPTNGKEQPPDALTQLLEE